MLRRDTDEVAVVLFVNLLAPGKVLDMSSSVEWNCCGGEKQSLLFHNKAKLDIFSIKSVM